MSLLRASLRREWQRLRADRRDWAMLTWVPLLTMALLCWIFSAGQPTRLPVALWNEDGSSALSRQLERLIEATPGLALQPPLHSRAQAQQALQAMQVYGVLHLPPGFARQVQGGGAASLTLLHNAQLATASSLLQRDMRQVVGTLSAGVQMRAAARRGMPAQVLRVRLEPVRTQLIALFNVSTNYEWFLATALVPALIHVLAMTAGAWTVGRELRDASLGQWLGQGPIRAWQALAALLGKLALPLALLWLVALAALVYLAQWRGWAVAGSLPLIALALGLLVAVSLAAGAALAALSLSLRTALSGAGLLAAPAFAYGGMGFPLLAMDASARSWALAMPYTHYVRLQVEQWQMGAPPAHSLPVLAGLLLATLALLLLASAGLQRGLRQPWRWGAR